MSESILFKRRSIRKFNDKPLVEEDFNYLLRAAMYAPTGFDSRDGEFVIVKNKDTMKEMMSLAKEYAPLTTASAVIVVCLDHNLFKGGPAMAQADGGSMSQNIVLAATERQIGSVWMGINHNEEGMAKLSQLLKLPAHVKPYSLIALGHFDTDFPVVKERFDPTKIHNEIF